MVVDSNNQIFKRKTNRETLFVNLQSYLVLVFHFFEFVPQIFKRWSQVRVVFPTFYHYIIPRGMSKKKVESKTVGPILNEQAF